MKKIITLASMFISLSSFANKHITQVVEGRFVKVGRGDYMHLTIIDNKNKKLSFICADLPKQMVKGIDCNDLERKPLEFKGKILKITYHKETNFIPEANEKITWEYVDRIDLKK